MLQLEADLGFEISDNTRAHVESLLESAHQSLLEGSCPGHDFLGWLAWPDASQPTMQALLTKIQETTEQIKAHSNILLVIGTGGSYLGSLAGLEFVHGIYYNATHPSQQIYFAGHDLSASSLRDLRQIIADQDFSINVISKSGTTLEPAVAFDYFWALAREKYGPHVNEHIYATTDAHTGTLHDLAAQNQWTSFIVPDNIGGRFSAMTSVGLLPLAYGSLNIADIIAGAAQARQDLTTNTSITNPAWQYAFNRVILRQNGKNVEFFTTYEPAFASLGLWWQQLFGESEGKTSTAILPAILQYTRDLHSLGQFLQEGSRNLFETVFHTTKPAHDEVILQDDEHSASSSVAGKSFSTLQQIAMDATHKAHLQGGVPQIRLTIPQTDEFYLGYTWYFFEFACALSALILGVNPFDQPGVQAYKAEMHQRLKH